MPTRAHRFRGQALRLAALTLALPLMSALPPACAGAGAQDTDRARREGGPDAAREARAPGRGAVAVGAELGVQGAETRLVLTLSKPVEARAFVMEHPDRAVIDLPEVNFQLPPEAGRRREGLVASFRYGLFAPGRSRLVLDLAAPALVDRIETQRARDGSVLVAIAFRPVPREAFARAALASDPAPPARRTPAAEPPDSRPFVVVDAGHGGTDPGAIARSGVFEKDIVFGFAEALVQRLRASGRYRVGMTRERDVFVPLAERVRIARDGHADLFVSIHADSIASARQVTGATIYTGSERATDAESARLAERENTADAAAGTDAAAGASGVGDILQELTLRETRGFSSGFAGRLLGQLAPVMEMSGKPHREAGFVVLRSPDVPSVLVELGYLSNSRDLERLLSEGWRSTVTEAMGKAIDLFFAGRAGAAHPFAPPGTTGSLAAPPGGGEAAADGHAGPPAKRP